MAHSRPSLSRKSAKIVKRALNAVKEADERMKPLTTEQRTQIQNEALGIVTSGPALKELTKEPIPFAPGWNQHRWEQLFKLEKLLNEVTMINHGSGALDRIQFCIELAKELRHDDFTNMNRSLPNYLKEQALGRTDVK